MKIGFWDRVALSIQRFFTSKNRMMRFLQPMAILTVIGVIGLVVTFIIAAIARLM